MVVRTTECTVLDSAHYLELTSNNRLGGPESHPHALHMHLHLSYRRSSRAASRWPDPAQNKRTTRGTCRCLYKHLLLHAGPARQKQTHHCLEETIRHSRTVTSRWLAGQQSFPFPWSWHNHLFLYSGLELYNNYILWAVHRG